MQNCTGYPRHFEIGIQKATAEKSLFELLKK